MENEKGEWKIVTKVATGAGSTTTKIDWCAACVGRSNPRSPSLARQASNEVTVHGICVFEDP